MIANNYSYLAAISIFSAIVLFLCYYLLTRNDLILNLFRHKENNSSPNPRISFLTGKVTGFVLFGIVPYLIFIGLAGMLRPETGLTVSASFRYWYILPVSFIIVPVLAFRATKSLKSQEKSPQLRIKTWSTGSILVSVLGWILYLLGYEFLFRGILWFICYKAFGFWPALLINVSLYSIAHLNQGVLMTLGAIPVGVIFCLFSFLTGSFLFAFLGHCCLAISNELFSIYNNPDLKFVNRKKRFIE
jgi:membrane protease YdiL (CAAX protease family)